MNYLNSNEVEQLKKTYGYEVEPILLSYHGKVHYNSIFNEKWVLPLKPLNKNVLINMRKSSFQKIGQGLYV